MKPLWTILLLAGLAVSVRADAPSWVEPMQKVHARFTGTKGTFAQFGDSITVTMAFWAPLAGEPKNMSPAMARSHTIVKKYQKPECWRAWKGGQFGSTGSMTIRWAHDNIDKWLEKLNPEVAVILFGTNDLGGLNLKEYEEKTSQVVDRCLKNGTIAILTTLPPRHGHMDKARTFAEAVRRIAKEKGVPVVDYFAEALKRRPTDWDGALPKFKDVPGTEYEVPTLIARDGVHPSNPKKYQDYSEESLNHNGYVLRNYLTLMTYAEVIMNVLQPGGGEGDALQKAVSLYLSFDEAVKVDHAGGERAFNTRFGEPQKGSFTFEKGFPEGVFGISKEKGISGGALEVKEPLPRNGRIFLPAKGNIGFKKGGWSGAVSFWMKTDPDTLLKTKFCDPVQITQKGANNGGIWVDFNDRKPRDFRMGAFPAVKEGEQPIKEEDPDSPLIRVSNPGFKAADWHHIAMTWTNFDTGKKDAHARLYVDGKLKGEVKDREIAMDWDLEKAGIYIGINYVGLLDEFAVFSRALTEAEVTQLHSKPGELASLKK